MGHLSRQPMIFATPPMAALGGMLAVGTSLPLVMLLMFAE
jgi:hypothetical protein